MDGSLLPIGIALAGLAVVVSAAALAWGQRQRALETQRRLAWSEQSRFEAEQHVEAMEARIAGMYEALRARRLVAAAADADAPQGAAGDGAERRAALGRALGRMSRGPGMAEDSSWIDTEPIVTKTIVPAFAETMPFDLELELAAPPGCGPTAREPVKT